MAIAFSQKYNLFVLARGVTAIVLRAKPFGREKLIERNFKFVF